MREKITEIIANDLHRIPDEKRDSNRRFYYADYKDNLIHPMVEKHFREYNAADGGEMEAKGDRPAKMASIASSSAMTFNLLGNEKIVMKQGQGFAAGTYDISYEKQMHTLNIGSNPANLDAFLANDAAGEAIFCEMKMLEWLGKPGALKAAYLKESNYFCKEAYEVFSAIAKALRSTEAPNKDDAYPSIFTQYDGWQMFKHTLAIYNATAHNTKEAFNKAKTKNPIESMVGRFKKITLANVVLEMDAALISDEKLRVAYSEAVEREHREAAQFIDIMLTTKVNSVGLRELFKANCGADFDICYKSVADFVAMFEKTADDRDYLKRYCCR